jgi:hypothetical protein
MKNSSELLMLAISEKNILLTRAPFSISGQQTELEPSQAQTCLKLIIKIPSAMKQPTLVTCVAHPLPHRMD